MEFETLTLPFAASHYLVAPQGLCQAAVPHRYSPVFSAPPEALEERLLRLIKLEPGMIERLQDKEEGQHTYVQRSFFLNLPEIVTFQACAEGEGKSSIAIYSRSETALPDFGGNKYRVESWLGYLEESFETVW
ncbi:hypothetical protein [Tepidicaulis sp.]|uniref:hypothetical protein n=1 Tax=Tepidicaulis sp. TaxID=1920809 RepID=UPI003B59CA2C